MKRTLVLSDDPRSVKRARQFMAEQLDGHDRQLVDDATLMVSELVTNSIRHATGQVTIVAEVRADVVVVHVYDDGPATPMVRSPSPTEPTGRGLRIVAELADDWGVARRGGGNEVWFRLRVAPGRRHSGRATDVDTRNSRAVRGTRGGSTGPRLRPDGGAYCRNTRSVLRSTTVSPAGFAPTRRCQLSRSVPST